MSNDSDFISELCFLNRGYNIKGICFELEDIEDWDQLKAPIDHIYVFRIT